MWETAFVGERAAEVGLAPARRIVCEAVCREDGVGAKSVNGPWREVWPEKEYSREGGAKIACPPNVGCEWDR